MNHRSLVAFFFALCVATSVAGLRAGPPPPPAQDQLTFQARITQSGQPINGIVALTFQLVDSPTPGQGQVLWSEDHDGSATGAPRVACTNGILSVALGSVVPIPATVFTPGSADRYVAILLGGTELARVKLTAGAYAVVSSVAGAVWDSRTSQPFDVQALDGRYVEATGDSIVLGGDVTGTGQWLAAPVGAQHGGTGQTRWAKGDLLYAISETETARLPAGTDGQVLTMRGGVPRWETPPPASKTRYALRYFPSATRSLSVPTGFKPRMVLVNGGVFFASTGAAMSPDGSGDLSNVVQAGVAWDVSASGGYVHDEKVFPHFGWNLTEMSETRVRLQAENDFVFASVGTWVAVFGEE